MIESPQRVHALDQEYRVDRLTTFLRHFELRVEFAAGKPDERTVQLALLDRDGRLGAIFGRRDIRQLPGVSAAQLVAGVRFGGPLNPLLVALDHPVEVVPAADDALALLLKATLAEFHAQRCGATASVERLCEAIVIQLLRHAIANGASRPGLLLGLSHPQIHRVLVAIHERPREAWRITDLAELAAMSRSAFMATFGVALGTSPVAYLTQWRLSEARRHIDRGVSVKQAAREVGFGSAEALSRAYRRVYGEAPSQRRSVPHQELAPR